MSTSVPFCSELSLHSHCALGRYVSNQGPCDNGIVGASAYFPVCAWNLPLAPHSSLITIGDESKADQNTQDGGITPSWTCSNHLDGAISLLGKRLASLLIPTGHSSNESDDGVATSGSSSKRSTRVSVRFLGASTAIYRDDAIFDSPCSCVFPHGRVFQEYFESCANSLEQSSAGRVVRCLTASLPLSFQRHALQWSCPFTDDSVENELRWFSLGEIVPRPFSDSALCISNTSSPPLYDGKLMLLDSWKTNHVPTVHVHKTDIIDPETYEPLGLEEWEFGPIDTFTFSLYPKQHLHRSDSLDAISSLGTKEHNTIFPSNSSRVTFKWPLVSETHDSEFPNSACRELCFDHPSTEISSQNCDWSTESNVLWSFESEPDDQLTGVRAASVDPSNSLRHFCEKISPRRVDARTESLNHGYDEVQERRIGVVEELGSSEEIIPLDLSARSSESSPTQNIPTSDENTLDRNREYSGSARDDANHVQNIFPSSRLVCATSMFSVLADCDESEFSSSIVDGDENQLEKEYPTFGSDLPNVNSSQLYLSSDDPMLHAKLESSPSESNSWTLVWLLSVWSLDDVEGNSDTSCPDVLRFDAWATLTAVHVDPSQSFTEENNFLCDLSSVSESMPMISVCEEALKKIREQSLDVPLDFFKEIRDVIEKKRESLESS